MLLQAMDRYKWEFSVSRDPQIKVEESLKPVVFLMSQINNFVDDVDWNSHGATISYLIPEKLQDDISTTDFIQFLIFNYFKTISLQFNSKQNKKLFTITGVIDKENCDWNLDIRQDIVKPMKLNINYSFKEVKVS